jgi:hypothetical protein
MDNNQKTNEQLLNEILQNLKILKHQNWSGEFLIEKEIECESCGSIVEEIWIDIDDMVKTFEI